MKKAVVFSIFIFIGIFLILFCIKLFSKPNEARYVRHEVNILPSVDLPLKDALTKYWTRGVDDLSVILKGGKIKRYDSRKNVHSSFSVDIKLTDIDQIARIIFYLDENIEKHISGTKHLFRTLIFKSRTINENDALYDFLCKYLMNMSAGGDLKNVPKIYRGPYRIVISEGLITYVELKKYNADMVIQMDINVARPF